MLISNSTGAWWLTEGLDIRWIPPRQLVIVGAVVSSHFISGHGSILYLEGKLKLQSVTCKVLLVQITYSFLR